MEEVSKLTKILSADQVRKADQYTIEHLPIASIDLMEKASKAFVSWFLKKFGIHKNLKVFCGIGNNGGDGLAISRLLHEHGCSVSTYYVGNISKASEDFNINFDRLKSNVEPVCIESKVGLPTIQSQDIIVDGIFGSGLTRPVEGIYAQLIDHINESTAKKVISIDIASGLFSDIQTPPGSVIECNYTVSFQVPKLSFYLPQSHIHTGELSVVDIGLDKSFLLDQTTKYYLINAEYIKSIYRRRKKHSHKGSFGKNLILSGSKGKIGATILATRACLRAGAGLVTSYVPQCGYNIMQVAVPEAMTITDQNEKFISEIPDLELYNSIGLGPGIGTEPETIEALQALFKKWDRPMVIDADAINIIAKLNLLGKIPKGSVLTPHPVEFERLAGKSADDFERLEKQRALSQEHGVVILLKGAHTSITNEDGNVFFNNTGNPGMATGGSGDVLAGVITSLIGQGYHSDKAAILGAYIHGLAGNLYSQDNSEEGLIASDLVEYLPRAFAKIAL